MYIFILTLKCDIPSCNWDDEQQSPRGCHENLWQGAFLTEELAIKYVKEEYSETRQLLLDRLELNPGDKHFLRDVGDRDGDSYLKYPYAIRGGIK